MEPHIEADHGAIVAARRGFAETGDEVIQFGISLGGQTAACELESIRLEPVAHFVGAARLLLRDRGHEGPVGDIASEAPIRAYLAEWKRLMACPVPTTVRRSRIEAAKFMNRKAGRRAAAGT
jgi:hypothetical protein